MRFSPRIARSGIIKQGKGSWSPGGENVDRQANLRKQTLKTSETRQEIDVKMAPENSAESRVAVGGNPTGHIDKENIVPRSFKTMIVTKHLAAFCPYHTPAILKMLVKYSCLKNACYISVYSSEKLEAA